MFKRLSKAAEDYCERRVRSAVGNASIDTLGLEPDDVLKAKIVIKSVVHEAVKNAAGIAVAMSGSFLTIIVKELAKSLGFKKVLAMFIGAGTFVAFSAICGLVLYWFDSLEGSCLGNVVDKNAKHLVVSEEPNAQTDDNSESDEDENPFADEQCTVEIETPSITVESVKQAFAETLFDGVTGGLKAIERGSGVLADKLAKQEG